MQNYRMTVKYDGTEYAGWQIQKSEKTVQGELKKTIEKILNHEINLIGSGRTDSGVHSFGQVASFNSEKEIDIFKIQHAINSLLPVDISISQLEKVDENFNPRFDATKRSYTYFFSLNKNPFYEKYSWLNSDFSDEKIILLNKVSKLLIDEKDYTSFAKKKTDTINKVCNIYNVHWKLHKEFVIFYIEANRFLHGMVRAIIGTLVESIKKDNPEQHLVDVINKKDRDYAGQAVPAKGLFLKKVWY